MNHSAPPTNVGIYCRISLDAEGRSLGVERQEQDARKLVKARGWAVGRVYIDNSVSAYKRGVIRPGFEELLEDLKNNVVDGIVVYDLDRLARQPRDLERVVDLYETRPMVFATVQADYDLSNSDGLFMARMMVNVANKASADTSRRQKRKNLQRAEMGLPHGGRRPFGYEAGGMVIREDEAAILREVAKKYLSGWSYRELAYDLNERGIKTTEGRQWFPITIRNMLTRKRYAGIREYEGVDYQGSWPAIYDDVTWQRLQLHRSSTPVGKVARKYLLTGFLFCGSCGHGLNGETKRDHPGRPLRRTYQCRVHGDTQRQGGCGGVTRGAEPLEHFIRELIVYRLDTPELSALVHSDTQDGLIHSLTSDVQRLTLRLTALLDDYTDGTLTKGEYVRARSRAQKALQRAEKALADQHRQEHVGGLVRAGESVRERWNQESNGWRRRIIGLLIDRIDVDPGSSKPFYEADGVRYRFDSTLIRVHWKA